MAHPYSSVILFSFIDLVGFGGIIFFFDSSEMNWKCIFSLETLKGVGIKSPHTNKTFFISSDTKHKAG